MINNRVDPPTRDDIEIVFSHEIEVIANDFPDRKAMSRRIAFQRKQLRQMGIERDAAITAMNEAFSIMRESQKEAAALRQIDFHRLQTLEHMGALVERLEATEAALATVLAERKVGDNPGDENGAKS